MFPQAQIFCQSQTQKCFTWTAGRHSLETDAYFGDLLDCYYGSCRTVIGTTCRMFVWKTSMSQNIIYTELTRTSPLNPKGHSHRSLAKKKMKQIFENKIVSLKRNAMVTLNAFLFIFLPTFPFCKHIFWTLFHHFIFCWTLPKYIQNIKNSCISDKSWKMTNSNLRHYNVEKPFNVQDDAVIPWKAYLINT